MACIQTLDNVAYTPSQWIGWHCRCALFQPGVLASQPFCLLPASNHLHYSLVLSLHLSIHLRMVRHGPQFLHTQEVTHLINDAAYKVSTPITQETDWEPEDWDTTLIQVLGDCFSCLIRGHLCHNVFHEMVLEQQDVGNSWQYIQLQGHLYASKFYMQEVHWSSGHNWV